MTIIASHADYRPEDFAFPRTQGRYSGKLEKSAPPIRLDVLGMILALCDAAVSAVSAWVLRVAR